MGTTTQPLDVALAVRRSDHMGDWYIIEREEHDGRMWMEPIEGSPNCMQLMCSSRIGNADIEGTFFEMGELAKAILSGGRASFKRCSAVTTEEGVLLCSPRNTTEPTLVKRERALKLAEAILALPSPPTDS